jgi:murein DD-endopeptidase MepM/ murein hydrolase activator NlpD
MRRVKRRGGLLDLPLVALVLFAVLTRTPIGGLAEAGAKALAGDTSERKALTAYFLTGIPVALAVLVEQSVSMHLDVPEGGLPEPWRTAATLGLPKRLPDAARALAEAENLTAEPLPILDHLYQGSPEAALEIYAIGVDQRNRAIERAEATGVAFPDRFLGHRPYLPADAARLVDKVLARTAALATVLDLQWPLATKGRISSGYGERHHPVLGRQRFHNGVDIAVPIGTSVVAAQDATVAKVAHDNLNGNHVVLDHGHGVRTSYCHLDSVEVAKGERITAGTEIAKSGNTGRSTGPHLHWTVRVGRKTVDPMKLRPAGAP